MRTDNKDGIERILAGPIKVERTDGFNTITTELTIPTRLNGEGSASLINKINSALWKLLQEVNFSNYGFSPASGLGYTPDHPDGQPMEAINFTAKGDHAGTYTDLKTKKTYQWNIDGSPVALSHPLSAVHLRYDPYYQGDTTKLLINIDINANRADEYTRLLKQALKTQIDNIDVDGMKSYRERRVGGDILDAMRDAIRRGKAKLWPRYDPSSIIPSLAYAKR